MSTNKYEGHLKSQRRRRCIIPAVDYSSYSTLNKWNLLLFCLHVIMFSLCNCNIITCIHTSGWHSVKHCWLLLHWLMLFPTPNKEHSTKDNQTSLRRSSSSSRRSRALAWMSMNKLTTSCWRPVNGDQLRPLRFTSASIVSSSLSIIRFCDDSSFRRICTSYTVW